MPYIGSAPTKVVSRQSATVYRYTATAGQTVFSGVDLDNAVLACNPADMIVHMNGIRLESTDYTATSTSVTLVVAAAAGDEVTVTSFQTFEVADTYDKATSDARYMMASGGGGLTVTSATISGDLTVDTNTLYVDSTNNRVGVGTASPSETLDVSGNIRALGANSRVMFGPDGFEAGIKYATDASLQIASRTGESITFTNGHDGAERMRIDSAGRVTMPYQPAFSVTHSSNAFLSGTIIFNTAQVNVGGHYSTSTGRFTAPVAGNYYFIFATIVGNSGGFNLELRKNGSGVTGFGYSDSGSNDTGVVAKVISLSAGDYVNAYTSSGNIEAQYSSFAGYPIG